MSVSAYDRSALLASNPRDTEYRIFSLVVSKLANANTPERLIDAVYQNSRLWSVLAADLAKPENKLGPELKARLLSLAVWSMKYGTKVMAGNASVDPLISVNKEVMAGLRPVLHQPQTQGRAGVAATPVV